MAHSNLTQLCIRRLQKEYKDLVKFPIQNLKIYISSENLLDWYFCIYNLDDQRYKGGEYYGLVRMDPDYPYKPPIYYMYTPNGRFVTGQKICTTNSNFHPDEWKPTWSMGAIFRGFLSLFLEDNTTAPVGFNHLRTTKEEKQRLARQSKEYNREHNSTLFECFASGENVIDSRTPEPIKIKLKKKPITQELSSPLSN